MYKIISAGKIVALCDAPRYVTRNPDTGALVEPRRRTPSAYPWPGRSTT